VDEFIASAVRDDSKTLVKQRNYLLRAHREKCLNYAKVLYRQLPIVSGSIESLIRSVFNLRMKGNNKFRLKENAEIMLHFCCQ
jgi:hypothetical protein